ncbi:MAG: DEAD/DEAH box helicase [Firmicutes bacterium]|jgi:superfamily II DNA/RNA helicase|nr:DEAD/DEAH box helicase [Bacillota bacterium]
MKFNHYKLGSDILKALDVLGYNKATDVQEKVIPLVLDGRDVIVKSQTGSGKTASFAIPIGESIEWDENKPQALILTPTRELAIQVKEELFNIGRYKRIKVNCVYGKSPIRKQIRQLSEKTHAVVATPGRLLDHIDRGTIDLSKIKFLVLDEADEMLNMGFLEDVNTIISKLPKNRITMLLSATMSKAIQDICDKNMNSPEYVDVVNENDNREKIAQEVYQVNNNQKKQLLKDIAVIFNPDSCIIFCNTKLKVEEVYKDFKKLTYHCNRIHGGMEQDERIKVMNNFKKGHYRYLIATDVAARGIDVDNVSLVVNYDFPLDKENYVHRIGRTGRKNNSGNAVSFINEREIKYINEIEDSFDYKMTYKDYPCEDLVSSLKDKFEEKMNLKPKYKETKNDKLNKNILKLHINAGKKTKMRTVDIVGTLCNIDGMSSEDIGIINVYDISTYVEILNGKGEMVLDVLQSKTIKGRIRKVSRAGFDRG